jgi:hypothetical protein
MPPVPSYINPVYTWAGIITIPVNVPVATVNPFAGYPVSSGIGSNRADINRLNRLGGYIIITCT